MSFQNIKKVHFIGIGGISMSSIAESLLDRGVEVFGSDKKKSATTIRLEKKGAKIYYNHDAKNIGNPDIVVYTGAIEAMNPEYRYAQDNNIKIMRRTEMLNLFLKEHKVNIAISGTHGKTTTSSMLTHILEHAEKKPNFLIGAMLPTFKSSHRLLESDYLVLEACEYQSNFLDFDPSTIVINNIDYDHVDYYRDLDHVVDTFKKFAKKLSKDGKLIINSDDKNISGFESDLYTIYTFGINNDADFMAKNIRVTNDLGQIYDLYVRGEKLGEFKLPIIGKQNVYNSLGAIAAAMVNGLEFEDIKEGLCFYKGALRRFELIDKKGESMLVSDYAHHPTEIVETLKAVRTFHSDRLVVIFQPHTYTRTKSLLSDLSTCFELSDEVYIVDIDPIREEDIYNISSLDLVNEIKKNSDVSVNYIAGVENVTKYVNKECVSNNIVIAMGAGEIDSVIRKNK